MHKHFVKFKSDIVKDSMRRSPEKAEIKSKTLAQLCLMREQGSHSVACIDLADVYLILTAC